MFPSTLNYGCRGRDAAFGDIESLLEQFFRRPARSETSFVKAGEGFPPLVIREDQQSYSVEAELPGVALENIDISLSGTELTVKGKRRYPAEDRSSYHRQERFAGEFTRVIKLGAEIDAAKITAALKDGILTIALPKGEAAKPRKIEVRGQ